MRENLIDVHVSLGRWPFQQFEQDTAERLLAHLHAEHIVEAWVSSIDTVLFPDPDVHDELLRRDLRPHGALRLVKTINPTLGTWRDSLDEAVEQWGAAAIRIVPNYHRYQLTDYVAAELMEQVARHDVPLFVQLRLDDERNQYPLMRVPAVPAGAVAQLAKGFPEARVVVLGAYEHELAALASTPNVCADIAFVERAAGVGAFPMERRLFGSHTPFLYTRSARMKLEYGAMSDADRTGLARDNARRFLHRAAPLTPVVVADAVPRPARRDAAATANLPD